MLLSMFQLRILLLRREEDGGEGAQNEEEASANGTPAAVGLTRALLRPAQHGINSQLDPQQPAFPR